MQSVLDTDGHTGWSMEDHRNPYWKTLDVFFIDSGCVITRSGPDRSTLSYPVQNGNRTESFPVSPADSLQLQPRSPRRLRNTPQSKAPTITGSTRSATADGDCSVLGSRCYFALKNTLSARAHPPPPPPHTTQQPTHPSACSANPPVQRGRCASLPLEPGLMRQNRGAARAPVGRPGELDVVSSTARSFSTLSTWRRIPWALLLCQFPCSSSASSSPHASCTIQPLLLLLPPAGWHLAGVLTVPTSGRESSLTCNLYRPRGLRFVPSWFDWL